jgi:hypothetical protein
MTRQTRMVYNVGVTAPKFPLDVPSHDGFTFRVLYVRKGHDGRYVARVQRPQGGRGSAKAYTRDGALRAGIDLGHRMVAQSIARGWLD